MAGRASPPHYSVGGNYITAVIWNASLLTPLFFFLLLLILVSLTHTTRWTGASGIFKTNFVFHFDLLGCISVTLSYSLLQAIEACLSWLFGGPCHRADSPLTSRDASGSLIAQLQQ